MVLAILSTVSMLATILTLAQAVSDVRERRRLGVNGTLSMLARQSVWIESLRIFKHVALAVSVWCYVLKCPQPWLNTLTCLTLGGTSLLTRHFRSQAERKVQQDKRAAALKGMQHSSVSQP